MPAFGNCAFRRSLFQGNARWLAPGLTTPLFSRLQILQARPDIGLLQVGIILEDLPFRGAAGQHFENVLDPNSHAADAGTPAALFRINGDAVEKVHNRSLSAGLDAGKSEIRKLV